MLIIIEISQIDLFRFGAFSNFLQFHFRLHFDCVEKHLVLNSVIRIFKPLKNCQFFINTMIRNF